MDIGVAHYGLLGVLTRYSISEENGYAAVCKVTDTYYDPYPPSFYGEIHYIDSCFSYERLVSIELPGAISSISIVAHGENPVYLEAWFDGHCLTTNDYIYNLTEGYGGIFAEGCMCLEGYLDDFLEEEVYENIKPASLGYIKAIMSE